MGSGASAASENTSLSLESILDVAKENPKVFARNEDQELDERALVDNPGLFCTLSTLLGRKSIKKSHYTTSNLICSQQNFNLVEQSEFDILNMDDEIDGKKKIKSFMEAHKLDTLSAIQAECQCMVGLEAVDPYFANKQFMLSMLNLSHNQLNKQSLTSSTIKQSTCLLQLNIGGNTFTSMHDIMSTVPISLLILDVSFTEGILFPKGVFLGCPQLLQLSIDGCGIVSTTFKDESEHQNDCALAKACSTSIFYGLVNLVNLSMKENLLESADDLQGLSFFAVQNNNVITENEGYTLSWEPMLCNISIAENPLCESSAELKKAVSYITRTLPSVQKIDDKVVHTSATHAVAVDRSSTQFRKQHAHEQKLREGERGSAAVSDAMEREFTAALRGEKDNAVVA